MNPFTSDLFEISHYVFDYLPYSVSSLESCMLRFVSDFLEPDEHESYSGIDMTELQEAFTEMCEIDGAKEHAAIGRKRFLHALQGVINDEALKYQITNDDNNSLLVGCKWRSDEQVNIARFAREMIEPQIDKTVDIRELSLAYKHWRRITGADECDDIEFIAGLKAVTENVPGSRVSFDSDSMYLHGYSYIGQRPDLLLEIEEAPFVTIPSILEELYEKHNNDKHYNDYE